MHSISLASDHAGYPLKQHLHSFLVGLGYQVIDLGPEDESSVDYPAYAAPAARLVANGEVDYGVIVCGSGVGVAIVANKIDGVRAVNAHDPEEAEMSRRHNNANVVTLGGRRLTTEQADKIVQTFLTTEFEGGRHQQRVDQITALEN